MAISAAPIENIKTLRRINTIFTMSAFNALRVLGIAVLLTCSTLNANNSKPKFKVIAFFTAKQEQAHISFVNEANRWFPEMAEKYISAMTPHPIGRI